MRRRLRRHKGAQLYLVRVELNHSCSTEWVTGCTNHPQTCLKPQSRMCQTSQCLRCYSRLARISFTHPGRPDTAVRAAGKSLGKDDRRRAIFDASQRGGGGCIHTHVSPTAGVARLRRRCVRSRSPRCAFLIGSCTWFRATHRSARAPSKESRFAGPGLIWMGCLA